MDSPVLSRAEFATDTNGVIVLWPVFDRLTTRSRTTALADDTV
jgi:hypothetical protein